MGSPPLSAQEATTTTLLRNRPLTPVYTRPRSLGETSIGEGEREARVHPRKWAVLALLACYVHVPKHNAQEEPAHVACYGVCQLTPCTPASPGVSQEGRSARERGRGARVHPRKCPVVEALECCGSHPHPHHDDEEGKSSAQHSRGDNQSECRNTYAVNTRPRSLEETLDRRREREGRVCTA